VRARRKVTRLVIDLVGFNNRSLGEIREAGSDEKRERERERRRGHKGNAPIKKRQENERTLVAVNRPARRM